MENQRHFKNGLCTIMSRFQSRFDFNESKYGLLRVNRVQAFKVSGNLVQTKTKARS